MLLVVVALAGGCAAPYLTRVQTDGLDPARVAEDKLACSQEAQERMTWQELGVGLFFGPAGGIFYEARSEEVQSKQARMERAAEACMARRGYRIESFGEAR